MASVFHLMTDAGVAPTQVTYGTVISRAGAHRQPRLANDFFREMIRRGVHKKVSWTCSSRVEVVDKPLLQEMKDAGCWRTRFGVESGHDDVLDFISKGITTEKVRKAITAAHEVGLRPKAFFMVGHMPDTRERILATIEFAKSIPLHDVTVQIVSHAFSCTVIMSQEKHFHRLGRVVLK